MNRRFTTSVGERVVKMDLKHQLSVALGDRHGSRVLGNPIRVAILETLQHNDAGGVHLTDNGYNCSVHLVEIVCTHGMWLVENFKQQILISAGKFGGYLSPYSFETEELGVKICSCGVEPVFVVGIENGHHSSLE
jgi:hypothetical protein